MIDYFLDGLPGIRTGAMTNNFVSGRISARLAPHGGLDTVSYYGLQPLGRGKILSGNLVGSYCKLMRLQIMIDGKFYFPEFNNTLFYPFGYRSECKFENVKFRHELVLDKDTLYQRVSVVDNPEKHQIGARILHNEYTWNRLPERNFSEWKILDDNSMSAEMTDSNSILNIKLSCNLPLKTVRCESKYFMESTEHSTEVIFALSFDSDASNSAERMNNMFRQYETCRQNGITIETGSEKLDSALNNILPTLNALAVPDVPGAVRASQSYWIWGWDSMVHAEAYLWSGNTEIVRNMLNFYRETADPELGIVHALTPDFKILHVMKICSQGLYIVLLHNYYMMTGDIETVRNSYEFVKTLLKWTGDNKHSHCRLGKGRGFFPDFPEVLQQEDADISLINNSLYLQSLRAASALEEALGNIEESKKIGKDADVLQSDMETLLWDEKNGYWVDSICGADLGKRSYHPVYGQLYVSSAGIAPNISRVKEIAMYMRRHFLFAHGLYMYVPDEPGFMADGNQLGAYYPPMDRYFWNMMNLTQDVVAEKNFQQIVEYFWNSHTYPEGLTHETVNDDPTVDEPGGKQAFTMKGWFCDALELNLGLRVYPDGFSCNPLKTGTRFVVRNLVLRDKKLTLERTENNTILLNGKILSSGKHSWSELERF